MNNYDELRRAAEAMAAYDSGDVDLGEDYNYVADLYTSLADHQNILAILDENAALREVLGLIRDGECGLENGHEGEPDCRVAQAREALGDAP